MGVGSYCARCFLMVREDVLKEFRMPGIGLAHQPAPKCPATCPVQLQDRHQPELPSSAEQKLGRQKVTQGQE